MCIYSGMDDDICLDIGIGIALKLGLRLMRGEQSKDCHKSAQSLPVVELSAK